MVMTSAIARLVRIRYCLGFAAAKKAMMSAELRSRETRYFPSCLDLLVRGPVATNEEGLGTSNPSYDGSASPAVTGITSLGDGMVKAKKEPTVASRPLHVLTDGH
jgi:hypothetical protein